MPVCVRCGRVAASAELRRRRQPHQGEWICRLDVREACRRRRAEQRKAARDQLRIEAQA